MGKPKDDPANHDPFVQGGEHGFIGTPVCSYNAIFDDEAQLKNFYAFIRNLKKKYPEVRTIGGRIDKYLSENYVPYEPEQKTIDKPKKAKKNTTHNENDITTTDSNA